jgi:hypothetical protein
MNTPKSSWIVFLTFLISSPFAAQAGTTQLQMSGSITAGTKLSAAVTMLATNHFITCESRNSGGWFAPKISSVAAQVNIENGAYTLEADMSPGFCGYEAKSIELSVQPANAAFSNLQSISVDSPLVGTPGYDDITNVSSLDCQAAQTSSSGLGLPCAIVKTDGTESATGQINILGSELNSSIHLNITTH